MEDPAAVSFNDHAQYTAKPTADRARLRYVLVSHDNDGVTKFGADLVTSRPRWLSPGSPPVQEVPGSSPRGVPPRCCGGGLSPRSCRPSSTTLEQ
jgi:hypothetical protein